MVNQAKLGGNQIGNGKGDADNKADHDPAAGIT